MYADIVPCWRGKGVVDPLSADQGVDEFDIIIIFINYRSDVFEPPPSLRDTSASGGHGIVTFAITTQPPGGVGIYGMLLK